MKFVKFVLNTILFAAIIFFMSLMSYGVSWILTAQSGEDTASINLVNTEDSKAASYQDAFTWYVVEIKSNFEDEAKYRVRNWVSWEWYKTSVGYGIDVAVDKVVAVCSPIVLPLWNISQLQKYYIVDYTYISSEDVQPYSSTIKYVEGKFAEEIDAKHVTGYTETALKSYETQVKTGEITFGAWVDNYPDVYETMFRIAKYNRGNAEGKNFEKMFNKLITTDYDGSRHINPSVYVLYINIVIDIIVSVWFLNNNHIVLERDRATGEIIAGGGLKFFRKRNRRKRRKDKNKSEEE